jgi:hypothetical protein
MFLANVAGFDSMKTEYTNDEDFGSVWNNISKQGHTAKKEYIS